MTTREQAIEIVAANLPHPDPINLSRLSADIVVRLEAERIVRALLAAGVIPAEGMMAVDRGRWERVSRIVVTQGALNMMENEECERGNLYTQEERDMIWDAHSDAWDALLPNDLDAIPDAPTGEGER